MSDDLDGFESEHEMNDEVHSNLISAVTQLEGKHRVKVSVRKEPTVEVSEFHLVKSGTGQRDAVQVHELASVLGARSSHNTITDKIKKSFKAKTLPKPLEKIEANRIDRAVRYQNVHKEVSRWDAVVSANRVAMNLSFPLNHETITIATPTQFHKKFIAQTPLEVEIEKALNNGATPTDEEEPKIPEFPLTLKELVLRRKELARLRAQQSYREAKAGRQHKIKSKTYHRVLRKEKVKQQLKDFEVLKNTDPELALQQLEELDKTRAEERASLRHRSTGKWAKGRALRAKYDAESRKVLAQQLAISRDLTQKVRKDESSDEEDLNMPMQIPNTTDNPWVGPVAAESEVADFLSEYEKYREKQNILQASKSIEEHEEQPEPSNDSGQEDEDPLVDVVDAEKAPVEVSITKIATHPDAMKSRKKANDKVKFSAEKGSETGKVAVISPAKTKKPKSVPHFDVKNSTKKANGKVPKQIGAHKKGGLKQGSKTDGKIKPSGVNPRIQQNNVDNKQVANTSETSRKRKKNLKPTKVSPGCSSLLPDENDGNPTKKKLLRKDVNIDSLFENIDQKFKKKLAKKMSKLKAELQIRDGNFTVAGTDDENEDEGGLLAFKKHAHRPELDEPLDESTNGVSPAGRQPSMAASLLDLPDGRNAIFRASKMQTGDDIDPNKFMAIKPMHLKTQLPDTEGPGDDALDDEDTERQMTITEAFAGDNVVADFLKEKEEEERSSKPEPIALTMPGWGSWDDQKQPKCKRKEKARKKRLKNMVIISKKVPSALTKHLVDTVPFPFTSAADYEASIRAPLGNTWISETAHKKLCAPRVCTKLGTIIRPMTEDSLTNKMSLPMEGRPEKTKRKY